MDLLRFCIVGITASLLVGAVPAPEHGPEPQPAQEPTAATLHDLGFMAGGWRADHDGSRLEEHFTAPRDGSIVGMFRWSGDGGTRMTEHMVIEQRDDGVFLFLRHFNPGAVAWESEQADGPSRFRLDSVGQGHAVFVDPDRDFPRRIVYHREPADRMTVRLEGRSDSGERREMEFVFRSMAMTTSTESLTAAGLDMGYNGGLTIAFQVKDLARSLDWYQNVLGFKLVYHLEEMGWCELSSSVAGVSIGLSQVATMKPGGPTPTFGVNDIDRARSLLEGKNVRFDGETIEIPEMVKLATFFDPDGNSLMLFQSLSDQMP
jgi:catechol 2,3-dioxygenase-like lactoylglutathione lyase family enzyme